MVGAFCSVLVSIKMFIPIIVHLHTVTSLKVCGLHMVCVVSVQCVSLMWFAPFVSVFLSIEVCIPIIAHLRTVTSLKVCGSVHGLTL